MSERNTHTGFSLPPCATLAQWQARRAQLIEHLRVVAGLDPAWPKTPLRVYAGTRHVHDGFSVEPLWLETLPGFYLGGALFRPVPNGGRRPAVLNPHGHAHAGRFHHDAHFATLLRCATLARLGYVAFAWDMVGYGDTQQLPHRFESPQAKLWGLTPLSVQLYNSLRAFDFLAGLPDVDPTRIACTGESGGGTQTFLLAAVQPDLAAAAPVCMVSAHFQGGCVCEHAPGLRTETYNVEIAALFAPRPLFLVSASGDWTLDNPVVELPDVRQRYALYGRPEAVQGAHFDAPHNYNAASRQAVYRWLLDVLPTGVDPATPIAEPDLDEPTIAAWHSPSSLLPAAARRSWPNGDPGSTRRPMGASTRRARAGASRTC